MGNTLCKNRVNHSNNSKSPVDRVLGRCAQICPKSLGKQKHFWDKQVLETSPPHQTQPKAENSDWHSATLTVPDSPNGQPIAPPRKKRPSMLHKDDPPVRNGFKEIFAGQRSESTTTSDSQGDLKDFTDFEKMPLNRGSEKEKQKREKLADASRASSEEGTSESGDGKTSTLSHKVSKVGNKKSDKFFGENLSDCLSDVPVVHDDDKPIEKIECSVTQKEATPPSQDRTDEAIANMIKESLYTPIADKRKKLDDTEDAIRDQLLESLNTFKNVKKVESIDEPDRMVAVEEPLIAKTIVKRHICDDEEELRHRLHLHAEDEPGYVVPDPNAPKKPQRDFSKYKKNNEGSKSNTEEEPEDPTKPSPDLLTQIKNELPPLNTLLTPKDNDKKPIDNITADSLVDEITKELNSEKRHETESYAAKPVAEPEVKKLSTSEKVLRRQLSSQSYLTPDLVEKIANQASFHADYQPEDYSSFSDGSEISPNSKLIQKRTLSSHSSQPDLKIEISETSTKGSIDKLPDRVEETEQSKMVITEPETPPVDVKLSKPDFSSAVNSTVILEPVINVARIPETPVRTRAPRVVKQGPSNEDISKAIKSFMDKDDLRPEDVLHLLEDEFGEYLNSTSLPAEDRKLLDDLRIVLDSKLDEVEKESIIEPKESDQPTETEDIDKPDQEDNPILEEQTPKAESLVPIASSPKTSLHPARQISDEKRRHSIDEFDHWFAGSLSKKFEMPLRKRRRELSLPGYLITEFNSEDLENVKDMLPDSDSEGDAEHERSDTTTHKAESLAKLTIETIPEIVDTVVVPVLETSKEPHVAETPNSSTESTGKAEISDVSSEPSSTVTEILKLSNETETPEKSSESPVVTNSAENVEDTNQNKINKTPTNLDEQPRLIERGDDKRKSVGHSLLLKFLDVERSNSHQ